MRTVFLGVGLGVPAVAMAWAPGDGRWFQAPVPVDSVVAADLNGGLALVVVGPKGLVVLDPRTGGLLAQSPVIGKDVLVRDLDGDGWQDILVCTDKGLSRIPLVRTGLGAPIAVTNEACSVVVAVTVEGGGMALVTAGKAVSQWTVGTGGKLGAPQRLPGTLAGAPLLAVAGDRLAVGGLGDRAITEQGSWGNATVAASGAVGGLALGPRSWTWSVPADGVVEDVSHQKLQVAPGPGAMASADLDGDGTPDLLVAHPTLQHVGYVLSSGSGERLVPVQAQVARVAAADTDGDRCPDIIVSEKGGQSLYIVAGNCTVKAAPSVETGVVAPQPTATATPATTQPAATMQPATTSSPPAAVPIVPPATVTAPATTAATTVSSPPADSAPATQVPIGDGWNQVAVKVGEPVNLLLTDTKGQANQFAARGGPLGMAVLPDGRVRFVPTMEDVGSWRVAVRMWGGSSMMRSGGFVLLVTQ